MKSEITRYNVIDYVEEITFGNDNPSPSWEECHPVVGEFIDNALSGKKALCDLICNIEDLHFLMREFERVKGFYDFLMFGKLMYRLLTNRNVISDCMDKLFHRHFEELLGVEIQSNGDDVENFFSKCRDSLDEFNGLQNHTIFKKFKEFLIRCIALGVVDRDNLPFNDFVFSSFVKEASKKQYSNNVGMIYMTLDLTLYVCEVGYACLKTNSLEPLKIGSTSVDKWVSKALLLKRQSTVLTNPVPHGFTLPEFYAELDDTIERGKSLVRFTSKRDRSQLNFLGGLLFELEVLKTERITHRAACSGRLAPFSMLVYGTSGVAKSLFVQILYKHFGKTVDLPIDDHFKFTVNSLANFWDNFESYKWCLHLDDIAAINPNASNGVDPSLEAIIQAVNNVCFVPDQAAIEKKGKTPFMGDLVLATTNTKMLNTYHYFSYPIAVLRRFKFVITVRVKDEYSSDNMLDPTKLPPLDGEYPNYWNIKVERFVANGHLGMAKEVRSFGDINEFLAWYSREIVLFRSQQQDAVMCDVSLNDITICKTCFKSTRLCLCYEEQSFTRDVASSVVLNSVQNCNFFELFKCGFIMVLLWFSYYVPIVKTPCNAVAVRISGPNVFGLFQRSPLFGSFVSLMRKTFRDRIGYPKVILMTITALSVGSFLLAATKFISRERKRRNNYDNQAVFEARGTQPVATEAERPNMWVSTVERKPILVPLPSASLNNKSAGEVASMFANNCVHLTITHVNGVRPIKAVCLFGNTYITNKHVISNITGEFTLAMISSPLGRVSSNVERVMSVEEFKPLQRLKNRIYGDLVYFTFNAVPPKRDIRKFFLPPDQNIGGYNGIYLSRDKNGEPSSRHVYCINECAAGSIVEDRVFKGHVKVDTVNGDCGSLLLINTPQGWVIAGLHVGGRVTDHTTLAIAIDDIVFPESERNISLGTPRLSSTNINRTLTELHHKSTINYTQQSTVEVYGSFVGFRNKPRSRVEPTMLCPLMQRDGYPLDYGPPWMSGWQPWLHASSHMVQPLTTLRAPLLRECSEAYLDNLFSNIPDDALKLVHVLDLRTTINGAPGVTYIDSINRKSSMGNPWRCSKKKYLQPDPLENRPDDVIFDKEILERYENIILSYEKGQRVHPNFCAHLKDEPVSRTKILAKKTRVFTGAPVDWSLVVRQYTLGVTRLFQTYRFASEMAVGAQVQTTEWDTFYKFLTYFGENTIVAGDYGKYDKRMPPEVILEAFYIIEEICKRAGYDAKALNVIRGIGIDTAFPLIDFNGDLLQFFGSNPSGHPLTVIVNSLVGSIYMRYVYMSLNPAKECKTFTSNVHILIYGDDNIMGVSSDIPWFNHTAIQNSFKELDIEYTMANKEADSVPYISITEATFLKRGFRYDEDLEYVVCPLEETSIIKNLMIGVRSDVLSVEQHALEKVSSSIREYFWYGRKIFNERRVYIRSLCEELELNLWYEPHHFPTYENLKEDFLKGTLKMV